MIEQTLCEQLVEANRRLTLDLRAERQRADGLARQLAAVRKRNHSTRVRLNKVLYGRDYWRARATGKATA